MYLVYWFNFDSTKWNFGRIRSFGLLPFYAPRVLGSRLVQAEIARARIDRHHDFQQATVGHHRFRRGLPVWRAEARRGFEHETGGWERPGNGEGGVAERSGEAWAGRDAGVQPNRDDPASDTQADWHNQIRLPVTVEITHCHMRNSGRIHSRAVVDWRLEGPIAVAQQHVHATTGDDVSHNQVKLAIAVEVANCKRLDI